MPTIRQKQLNPTRNDIESIENLMIRVETSRSSSVGRRRGNVKIFRLSDISGKFLSHYCCYNENCFARFRALCRREDFLMNPSLAAVRWNLLKAELAEARS